MTESPSEIEYHNSGKSAKHSNPVTAKRELSIVIPTLNERTELPGTLALLAGQQAVDFEIVLSDGGSTDGTGDLALASGLPVRLVRSERGRARQLNTGAAAATGNWLLFLHADSHLADPLAIRRGIDALTAGDGSRRAAGHFRLRFRHSRPVAGFGYRYYEQKALLDRAGCAHGDQGLLLPAGLLAEYGGFDESFPPLAETRLADRLRAAGRWRLLSDEIGSSARRFEAEGLRQRQTLNAVIMALAETGYQELLDRLPSSYRPQNEAGRLELADYLGALRSLIDGWPATERKLFWGKIGKYVSNNCWQVAFLGDVLLNGPAGTPLLDIYDRWLAGACRSAAAGQLAAVLARCWLYSQRGSQR